MVDGMTTGMTVDKRVVVGQKIQKLANEYVVDYNNMTEYGLITNILISMQFIHGMKVGYD